MSLTINLNIKIGPSDEVPRWAVAILDAVEQLAQQMGQVEEEIIMVDKSIDEVLADLSDEKTQVGGLVSLTGSLKQKLDDALAGVTLPPAVQAKINAAFDAVESNKVDIMNGINANTPAASVDPTATGVTG